MKDDDEQTLGGMSNTTGAVSNVTGRNLPPPPQPEEEPEEKKEDEDEEEEGVIAQSCLRCINGIEKFLGAEDTGMNDNNDGKQKGVPPQFWRQIGALSHLLRKVHSELNKFEYKSDIDNNYEDGVISLLPNIRHRKKKTTTINLHEGEIELHAEERQRIAEKSLEATLDGLLFSRKGANLFSDANAEDQAEFNDMVFTDKDFKDLKALHTYLGQPSIFGEEVWLDCLVTSLEEEEPQLVIGLFTDKNAHNMKNHMASKRMLEKLQQPIYLGGDKLLSLLELKAKIKYFDFLKEESEHKELLLNSQNLILHNYSTQLEKHLGFLLREQAKLTHQKRLLFGKFYDALWAAGGGGNAETFQGNSRDVTPRKNMNSRSTLT